MAEGFRVFDRTSERNSRTWRLTTGPKRVPSARFRRANPFAPRGAAFAAFDDTLGQAVESGVVKTGL